MPDHGRFRAPTHSTNITTMITIGSLSSCRSAGRTYSSTRKKMSSRMANALRPWVGPGLRAEEKTGVAVTRADTAMGLERLLASTVAVEAHPRPQLEVEQA